MAPIAQGTAYIDSGKREDKNPSGIPRGADSVRNDMTFRGRQGERKSTRLPLASRRPLQRGRQKAKPRAPWALGKAGRRLLESKNLPKEGLDMILVR